MLEVARGLLLDPKLMLIDEPSIGLSPLMVQEVFAILKDLRDKGVTILLIEQNAKQALQISDYGLVLEQGQTRIEDTAPRIPGRSEHRATVPRRRPGAGGGRGMSERSMLVGLIGANIMGSLSPALFADAFAAAGIDGFYHLMDVDVCRGRRLPQLLERDQDRRLCRHQHHLSRSSKRSCRCSTRSIPRRRRSARSIPWRLRRTAAPPATTSTGAACAAASRKRFGRDSRAGRDGGAGRRRRRRARGRLRPDGSGRRACSSSTTATARAPKRSCADLAKHYGAVALPRRKRSRRRHRGGRRRRQRDAKSACAAFPAIRCRCRRCRAGALGRRRHLHADRDRFHQGRRRQRRPRA